MLGFSYTSPAVGCSSLALRNKSSDIGDETPEHTVGRGEANCASELTLSLVGRHCEREQSLQVSSVDTSIYIAVCIPAESRETM